LLAKFKLLEKTGLFALPVVLGNGSFRLFFLGWTKQENEVRGNDRFALEKTMLYTDRVARAIAVAS
jgi:hypothetical protein